MELHRDKARFQLSRHLWGCRICRCYALYRCHARRILEKSSDGPVLGLVHSQQSVCLKINSHNLYANTHWSDRFDLAKLGQSRIPFMGIQRSLYCDRCNIDLRILRSCKHAIRKRFDEQCGRVRQAESMAHASQLSDWLRHDCSHSRMCRSL